MIGPVARMRNGPSVTVDPFVQMPDTISDNELADAVRAALWRSRIIPDLNLREAPLPTNPALEAAGVKSLSAFHRGARLIAVSADGSLIRVIPTVNRGARGGFEHLEPVIISETASSAELGDALTRALVLCK